MGGGRTTIKVETETFSQNGQTSITKIIDTTDYSIQPSINSSREEAISLTERESKMLLAALQKIHL
jgi:hypothetical protein